MKKREILVIAISIFLTVIAWLVADIIHASTRSKVEEVVVVPAIKNITLDENLIKILESKTE